MSFIPFRNRFGTLLYQQRGPASQDTAQMRRYWSGKFVPCTKLYKHSGAALHACNTKDFLKDKLVLSILCSPLFWDRTLAGLVLTTG